jgi:uncharacterized protein (TIGR02147 family)
MDIFQSTTYQTYLKDRFADKSLKKNKSQLAEYLNCHPGFISQVLSGGKTHFSFEHIYKVGQFLKLNKKEMGHLILLLQHEKAGSQELRDHFAELIAEAKKKNTSIAEKVSAEASHINIEDQIIYYGHWAYIIIHLAVSLSRFKTLKTLQEHFHLEKKFCQEVIDFLKSKGFIKEVNGKLEIGKTRIHLERTSPLIKNLHSNLRQKAVDTIDSGNDLDLHYSSVLTMGKKDFEVIRQKILNLIKEKEVILKLSPDEEVVIFNLDFLKL